MTCEPLAYTGSGVQLGMLVILGIVLLAVGAIVILLTRRRGRSACVAMLLLITGAGVAISAGSPTPALAGECPPINNSLTVVQTSVMDDLAPGIVPVTITGIVTNVSDDSTVITAVNVEIAGVSIRSGSAPGVCDASDYVLLDPRMPVGRTLAPGGSTAFAGASIGFSNKSTNQDTCKGATIHLLYTANLIG